MRKRFSWLKQFNWRMLLIRLVINAISLVIISLVTPHIYFVERSVGKLLIVSITLGLINAILKPLIQFLTFQLIFASYGIVIVFINSLLLWLLSAFFPQWFAVDSIFWAFVGGALLGAMSSFLEALFGLNLPIVPAEDIEMLSAIKQISSSDTLQDILDKRENKLESGASAELASVDLATEIPASETGDASEVEPQAPDEVAAEVLSDNPSSIEHNTL